ncbi:MAG: transcriptional regulatory protein [Frankiales bacterium]|jgi:hypothetical protein|nr:transcriptional regulatory protein [Frankiales bacterium]
MDLLPLPDVAERTGLDIMAVRQLLKDGRVLGSRRPEDGILCILADQLEEDGEPVKHLPAVITLLRDGRFSDEEALRWLTTPDESIPGTPLQALRENRGTEIKRRAQALGF